MKKCEIGIELELINSSGIGTDQMELIGIGIDKIELTPYLPGIIIKCYLLPIIY